jgi:DNA-binding response OmpR family regulator
MAEILYRALVVDDEEAVRKATIRTLTEERFACDAAANGTEAKRLLAANRYDVVVTDLQMPNGHGHALALELLALENHPAIVVLTGMLDPRLAKDLIGRGVDFVEFKPVRYDLLVAKIKAMIDRRRGVQPNYAAPLIAWKLDRQPLPGDVAAGGPEMHS